MNPSSTTFDKRSISQLITLTKKYITMNVKKKVMSQLSASQSIILTKDDLIGDAKKYVVSFQQKKSMEALIYT